MIEGKRRPKAFTLGTEGLDLERFFTILERSNISLVADVRSNPASSRPACFERNALSTGLQSRGLSYRWFRSLGGSKPALADAKNHSALKDEAARNYAQSMNTQAFRRTCEEAVGLMSSSVTLLLGTKADPWSCHRRLLCDKLTLMGLRVVHLMSSGDDSNHSLHPGLEVEGDDLIYRGRQLALL